MVVVHGLRSHICCASQEKNQRPVALSTQKCTVPGLTLIKDFVSEEEEQVMSEHCTQLQQRCKGVRLARPTGLVDWSVSQGLLVL